MRWLAQWLRNYAWEVAEHFWSPDWWLNSLRFVEQFNVLSSASWPDEPHVYSASMMRRLNLRKTYRLLALRQTTPLKLCLKLLQQERYRFPSRLSLSQLNFSSWCPGTRKRSI